LAVGVVGVVGGVAAACGACEPVVFVVAVVGLGRVGVAAVGDVAGDVVAIGEGLDGILLWLLGAERLAQRSLSA
jgi:hypothetical protein